MRFAAAAWAARWRCIAIGDACAVATAFSERQLGQRQRGGRGEASTISEQVPQRT